MKRLAIIVTLDKEFLFKIGDEEFTADGGEFKVSFGWVDFGIGSYEYWGNIGYDSRMGCEDVKVETILALNDPLDCDGEEATFPHDWREKFTIGDSVYEMLADKVDEAYNDQPEVEWDYPENL
jgi:hypothetical protein